MKTKINNDNNFPDPPASAGLSQYVLVFLLNGGRLCAMGMKMVAVMCCVSG